MQRNDPPHPRQKVDNGRKASAASDDRLTEPHAGDHADESLRRLEQRLGRASDTAERLIAEAAAQASKRASGRPPPAGWQAPQSESGNDGRDSELLSQVIHLLRELVPPELRRRLGEAMHELLLALRALIDWYLERVERRRVHRVEVQDIPIV